MPQGKGRVETSHSDRFDPPLFIFRKVTMNKKRNVMSNGKITVVVDAEEDVRFVRAKIGKHSLTFHQREFTDSDSMADAIVAWIVSKKATVVYSEQRTMTAKEEITDSLESQMIFYDIIRTVADEAHELDEWDDFEACLLDEIALSNNIHISFVKHIFNRIAKSYTPIEFRSFNTTDDDCSSSLLPLDERMIRLKDIVFGNTQADRMVWIDLRRRVKAVEAVS